jgi:hypothetical protein
MFIFIHAFVAQQLFNLCEVFILIDHGIESHFQIFGASWVLSHKQGTAYFGAFLRGNFITTVDDFGKAKEQAD